jgi:hypothetical protein
MNTSVKVLIAAVLLIVFPSFSSAASDGNLQIWHEFVAALKSGQITADRIRPYEGISPEVILGQLAIFKAKSDSTNDWKEWEAPPEVFPVDNQVHFLISLGLGDTSKTPYCFTFLIDHDRWYYRHVEGIFIRLDQTPSPPTSEFPDLPEQTKAWQREETYWSQIVYFYSVLTKEKGKDYFLNLMKDGAGYFLEAKTWVPFVTPQRAFILFVCWEQSRLRENSVSLEKLTDTEAVIKLQSQFFYLYRIAGHLKGQIPFENYRRIFETIWQDRAANAGWALEITCDDPECLTSVFHFTKKSE